MFRTHHFCFTPYLILFPPPIATQGLHPLFRGDTKQSAYRRLLGFRGKVRTFPFVEKWAPTKNLPGDLIKQVRAHLTELEKDASGTPVDLLALSLLLEVLLPISRPSSPAQHVSPPTSHAGEHTGAPSGARRGKLRQGNHAVATGWTHWT